MVAGRKMMMGVILAGELMLVSEMRQRCLAGDGRSW